MNSVSLDLKDSAASQAAIIPRDYNLAEEVEEMVASTGQKKSLNSIDKTIYLGFLAGIFVSVAGTTSIMAASGVDQTYTSVPKILFAIIFPFGLFFIVLFGGDLFTGNTMLLTVSYLHGKISFSNLLRNWILVFLSNFIGCLCGAYFLCYLSNLFHDDVQINYIHNIVLKKANLGPGVAFLRGIPANALVCLAIFLGLAARDIIGKLYGLWVPVFMFALCGYEHCVANMYFFSLGFLYDAPVTVSQFFINLSVVTLGNVVGGAFFVGFSEYYLYHWQYGTLHTHLSVGIPANVIQHVEGSKEVSDMRENVRKSLSRVFCWFLSRRKPAAVDVSK